VVFFFFFFGVGGKESCAPNASTADVAEAKLALYFCSATMNHFTVPRLQLQE